jgi:hypothetical protein
LDFNVILARYREQRVKARRNNKELLREELDFLKQYLNISRVRTSQVAEGERVTAVAQHQKGPHQPGC